MALASTTSILVALLILELFSRIARLDVRARAHRDAEIEAKLRTMPITEVREKVQVYAEETGNFGFPVAALTDQQLRETAVRYYTYYVQHQEIYAYDPDTIFRLKPGDHTLNMRAFTDCSLPSIVHIDKNGHRGLDHDLSQHSRGVRIACLGDSISFGWGVEDGKEYPALLGTILHDEGIATNVMNCGTPGFTSLSGKNYFCKHAETLDPDFVTIAFGVNDAVEFTRSEAETLRVKRSLRYRLIVSLNKLCIFRITDSLFNVGHRLEIASDSGMVLKPRVSMSEFRANITELIGAIRSVGAKPILMAVIPKKNQLERVDNPYAATVVELSRTLSTPLLHINSVIEAHAAEALSDPTFAQEKLELEICFGVRIRENPAYYFFLDSCHPTAIGHSIIARQLSEIIRGFLE